MADRSTASGRTVYRDLFTDAFVWRLIMLGAAALGFLVTFILLGHEIHALKNVMLPLLAILPIYLFLTSLNMWWAAKTTATLGLTTWRVTASGIWRLRTMRLLKACLGLAFGVLAALWYVHSVSK